MGVGLIDRDLGLFLEFVIYIHIIVFFHRVSMSHVIAIQCRSRTKRVESGRLSDVEDAASSV